MRKRTWRSALALLLVFALVFTSGLPAVAKTEENRADPTETAAVYLSDMEWTSAEDVYKRQAYGSRLPIKIRMLPRCTTQ